MLPYILLEEYIYILALETASSRNRHCANNVSAHTFVPRAFADDVVGCHQCQCEHDGSVDLLNPYICTCTRQPRRIPRLLGVSAVNFQSADVDSGRRPRRSAAGTERASGMAQGDGGGGGGGGLPACHRASGSAGGGHLRPLDVARIATSSALSVPPAASFRSSLHRDDSDTRK